MQRFIHRSSMSRLGVLAGTSAALALSAAAGAETLHFETDFAPGSWTALPAFFGLPPDPGQIGDVVSSRASVEGNWVIEQLISMNDPMESFNVIGGPVMINSFVHDPAVDGAVLNLSVSVKHFSNPSSSLYGGIRFFLEQDGRLFRLNNVEGFYGFVFNEPDAVHFVDARVATDFHEVGPGFVDFESHPDFSGGPMRFGFGYQLTSTGINGATPQRASMRFDDAMVRVAVVPPACLGDLNNDGLRNTADLVMFLSKFAAQVPPNTLGDLNGDAVVNTQDLVIFLGLFGAPCE